MYRGGRADAEPLRRLCVGSHWNVGEIPGLRGEPNDDRILKAVQILGTGSAVVERSNVGRVGCCLCCVVNVFDGANGMCHCSIKRVAQSILLHTKTYFRQQIREQVTSLSFLAAR